LAFDFGRALSSLGEEGALVIGSGSLTHNLYEFRQSEEVPAGYVQEFTSWIRQGVEAGDVARLIRSLEEAPHAARSHPTAEHFLPLLIALGAASSPVPATVLPGGIVHGVLSMESYVFGMRVPVGV